MARIYIADLAAYNEGFLFGEWVELPQPDIMETVEEILERTSVQRLSHFKAGINLKDIAEEMENFYPSEEWAIHDSEGFEFYGTVSEYEDLFEINQAVESYEALSDQDQKKLAYLMDDMGYDTKEAIDHLEECEMYEDMSYEDLAYEFVEEGLFGEIPKSIANYIDYAAIARDLSYDYAEHNGSLFHCA